MKLITLEGEGVYSHEQNFPHIFFIYWHTGTDNITVLEFVQSICYWSYGADLHNNNFHHHRWSKSHTVY